MTRTYCLRNQDYDLHVAPAGSPLPAGAELVSPMVLRLLLDEQSNASEQRRMLRDLGLPAMRPGALDLAERARVQDRLEAALRWGHVLYRVARRRVVMQIEPRLSFLGPEEDDKAYELLVRVTCEVTAFALPQAPLAIFDDKQREVWRGRTNALGQARVDVGMPGHYDIVVFEPRVTGARLLLVGSDGVALARTDVELEDSDGTMQKLATDDAGIVRIADASSGIAKAKVGDETARVYLHPRQHEHHVAKLPQTGKKKPHPYAMAHEPRGAKDPPPPPPRARATSKGGGEIASNKPALALPDAEVDKLNLVGDADSAARLLKKSNPGVKFTSGRRSADDQVHAMAVNVAAEIKKSGKRDWIHVTYVKDASHEKLQKWLDDHPDAKTTEEIAKGLKETVEAMSEKEKLSLSKHITGHAFDIEPGSAKEEDILGLPGLRPGGFIKKEGNLVRWHCQF